MLLIPYLQTAIFSHCTGAIGKSPDSAGFTQNSAGCMTAGKNDLKNP